LWLGPLSGWLLDGRVAGVFDTGLVVNWLLFCVDGEMDGD
jgi:hypothetical protein